MIVYLIFFFSFQLALLYSKIYETEVYGHWVTLMFYCTCMYIPVWCKDECDVVMVG